MPLCAKALAVDLQREEQDGGDGKRDEGELPIDPRGHVDHAGDGHDCGKERDQAADGDGLDGGGVVLDPVRGVRRSPRIVIRERETFGVVEKTAAELKEQLLAGVSGQHQAAELLQLLEERDEYEEPCRNQQDTGL